MVNSSPNWLLLAAVACLSGLAWLGSVLIASLDLRRRNASTIEVFAWLGLVIFVPLVGFGFYLFVRLLDRFFSVPRSGVSEREPPKRVTLVKPGAAPEAGSGTIPAADLLEPTSAVSEKGRLAHQPGLASYRFAVVAGPHAGQVFVLDRLPALIGRGAEAALRLDADQGVSRRHAEIYPHDRFLRIRDLRSTHGTQVNGFSISDRSLESGDRIQVGLSILEVRLDSIL